VQHEKWNDDGLRLLTLEKAGAILTNKRDYLRTDNPYRPDESQQSRVFESHGRSMNAGSVVRNPGCLRLDRQPTLPFASAEHEVLHSRAKIQFYCID
jgi:hypothetical protein